MANTLNMVVARLQKGQLSLSELGIEMSIIRQLREDGYNIIARNADSGRVYYIPEVPDTEKARHALLLEARDAVAEHGNLTAAAKALGMARSTLWERYNAAIREGVLDKIEPGKPKEKTKITTKKDNITIDYSGVKIKTPEQLIADANVDMDLWEIAETTINNWEVGGKLHQGQKIVKGKDDKLTTTWRPQTLWKTGLRQIKIRLRKIPDERISAKSLLDKLEARSPIVRKYKRSKPISSQRRCLEVSIMDPHYGMGCYHGSSDQPWSMEDCESICHWAIDGLLSQADKFSPIEQIIFPFGNDYLHSDNLRHETTRGTPMGEMMPYHEVYERGEALAIAMISKLSKVAPVRVLEIPGNHDKQSSFTLGRLLRAYFRNDENVEVDAGPSTYKFHRYGTNLIGFEHGHSIAPIRLAALMANERRHDWAETTYREWHLGDQHRKGSSKPVTFEEQGVSVEYLPGLTPPNEWHREKSFNYQKRGAMAYVWDFDTGQIARLQVNLNSYTGLPTGT